MTQRRFHTILLALAVAGGLGFGTTQAIASPKPEGSVQRACDEDVCRRWCISKGFIDGGCFDDQCWCNAATF
ncbi:MAG TPA: hypothetical protein VF092_26705 [Longimicrobium sp.]